MEEVKKRISREEFMRNQLYLTPCFLPPSGKCYNCGFDIASENALKGDDGKRYITGCPKCNRSFCE